MLNCLLKAFHVLRPSMSKVSLIGTGNVAKSLGSRLVLKGRPVSYGTRDPNNPKIAELKQQQGATVKTVAEAVDWADALILAVPGTVKQGVCSNPIHTS
jgi:predicted dinucleotide-binding enzyme